MKDIFEKYVDNLTDVYSNGGKSEKNVAPAITSFLSELFKKYDLNLVPEEKTTSGIPDISVKRKGVLVGIIELKSIGVDISDRSINNQLNKYKNINENVWLFDGLTFYKNSAIYPIFIIEEQINLHEKWEINIKTVLKSFNTDNKSFGNNDDLLRLILPSINNISKLINIYYNEHKNIPGFVKYAGNRALDELKLDKNLEHKIIKSFIEYLILVYVFKYFVKNKYDIENEKINLEIGIINKNLYELCDIKKEFDILKNIIESFSFEQQPRIVFDEDEDNKIDDIKEFYESLMNNFSNIDDPNVTSLKRRTGSYYTNKQLINFQVEVCDYLMKKFSGKKYGITNSDNKILEPACGSGVYFESILNKAKTQKISRETTLNTFVGFEMNPSMTLIANALLDSKHDVVYCVDTISDDIQDMFDSNYKISSYASKTYELKCRTIYDLIIGNPPYIKYKFNKLESKKHKGKQKKIEFASILGRDKNIFYYFIQKSEELLNKNGVISFVIPNRWLDRKSHENFRSWLRTKFDTIFVMDLHGEVKNKYINDENVFDIVEPVCILFCAKGTKKQELYLDLIGSRKYKLEQLQLYSSNIVDFFEKNQFKPKKKLGASFNDVYLGNEEIFIDAIFDIEQTADRIQKPEFIYKKSDKMVYSSIYCKVSLKKETYNTIKEVYGEYNMVIPLYCRETGFFQSPFCIDDKYIRFFINGNDRLINTKYNVNHIDFPYECDMKDMFHYTLAILSSDFFIKTEGKSLISDKPYIKIVDSEDKFYKIVDLGNKLRLAQLLKYSEQDYFMYLLTSDEEIKIDYEYSNEIFYVNSIHNVLDDNRLSMKIPKDIFEYMHNGKKIVKKFIEHHKKINPYYTKEFFIQFAKILKSIEDTIEIKKYIDDICKTSNFLKSESIINAVV